MGHSYIFNCPECSYSAEVSDGLDYGWFAVIRTMTCRDCRELVEVCIGKNGLIGPTGDPEYDRKIGICPECKGDNVQPWPDSHPCPRCEGSMTTDGVITILWD